MHKTFLKTAAIFGVIAVGLGAFAAHALKDLFSDGAVETFQIGVRYQFYHVIALLITGILYAEFYNKFTLFAGRFFIIGILLFSGSLYWLAIIQGMVQPGMRWVGAITPVGGLFFILGWISMLIGIFKPKTHRTRL